jgi:hypothetical protein
VARALPFPRAAFIAAIVFVALACGSIREDQLECEEAVTKLDECCAPPFDSSSIQCIYKSDGCGNTYYPDLDVPTSACIRSESCAAILSGGVCARALAAHPTQTDDEDNPEALGPATVGVCP